MLIIQYRLIKTKRGFIKYLNQIINIKNLKQIKDIGHANVVGVEKRFPVKLKKDITHYTIKCLILVLNEGARKNV